MEYWFNSINASILIIQLLHTIYVAAKDNIKVSGIPIIQIVFLIAEK
jgi:hypothetical protein